MKKLYGVMAVLFAIAGFSSQVQAGEVYVNVTDLNNGTLGSYSAGDTLFVVGYEQLSATGWATLKNETDIDIIGGRGLPFSLVFGNGQTSIPKDAMRQNKMLVSVTGETVTSVGEWAFSRSGLQSVSMPALESIPEGTFADCDHLASFELPRAKTIGRHAFQNNSSLTTISLPATTVLETRAFYMASSLTEVSLPSVTEIGNEAFSGCTSLKVLRLGNADPSVRANAFTGVVGSNLTIYSNRRALTSGNYPSGYYLATSQKSGGGGGCDATGAGLYLLLCAALLLKRNGIRSSLFVYKSSRK